MKTPLTFALAGNPNAGKTTLFNALTGARQHVGNYPGVTVERKSGIHTLPDGTNCNIVDLPGTYSLTAYSIEEVVARDFLVQERPDVVINIVDASNLERNLYLTIQLMELGVPLIIALNMMDVAHDRGIEIDPERLSALLGVPVVPIVARGGRGISNLMAEAHRLGQDTAVWRPLRVSYGEDLDSMLLQMEKVIEEHDLLTDTYSPRWLAMKYLENDSQIREKGARTSRQAATLLEGMAAEATRHHQVTLGTLPEALIADQRYGFIKSVLRQGVLSLRHDPDRLYTTDRIDQVLTNRLLGPVIMLAILFGLYTFTFTYSELPVAWLEGFFGWMGDLAEAALPDGPLKSLIISGIIDGVGGVLGFVPLIMFMFFGIAVLEDSGYLARVAFMMDRVFHTFGLHGSSVMAYIVSGGIAGGCAVPGVMATRTLKSRRERLATLLTVSFMNCGAKLPVLALLTAVFFAGRQAMVMFLLTLLAWAVAMVVAKIYRLTVLKGPSTPFVMELPPYRFPTLRGLLIHTWERTWHYIKKAGTVILAISVILWAMMTYPGLPDQEEAEFAAQRESARSEYFASEDELAQRLGAIDRREAERSLELSLAGRIGRSLEGISRLAGFDWRTNIALVGGFAAKEVVISTLGTAYSLGEVGPEASESLATTLANDPAWNPVKALAMMVFVMFYAPCFVTVVCIAREAGSWKWGALAMGFNTVFAFAMAVLIYQVGMFLGLG
ncbi:MAG TPA: ferrous iron transport protein B [Desulfurivibrio alkaliphilus]|uniref:Ferrous iron transport protein B n=1 Tax=Desulfurivibrio alkaliphilus TaxID=427923 RepID=A0A7C2TGJ4_9BACT|nr:ferrous iron transport protein B [Desulfurivibrio alkaliphilus]